MTFAAARLALTTQFELALAAHALPRPKVQYDNRNLIDTKTQVDPYVSFNIVNVNGKQLDLSNKPMSAQYGQMILTVMIKENGGTSKVDLLMDHFLPRLELKELGAVRTHTGMAAKCFEKNGWDCHPIVIPFWWLRVAT